MLSVRPANLKAFVSSTADQSNNPVISIVMPAHNEEAALPAIVERVNEVLNGFHYEIIIVDDGSSDSTWQTIKNLSDLSTTIRAIRFTRNFGHQSAILAGLLNARGDAVIMMDSDGQHPVELIPILIKRWKEGYSIVQAVRARNPDEALFKKLTSRVFYRVFSSLSGVSVPQGAADFRLLCRESLDSVLSSVGSLLFLRGLIPWLGYSVSYVEFDAGPRLAGQSSYTWRRMVGFSLDGLMTFSIVPLRISILFGIFVSILSFLYLAYTLVVWLTGTGVVAGWASVVGLLSLLGGIQLFMMGILGEYLGRLFLSNLNRPHYVICERI